MLKQAQPYLCFLSPEEAEDHNAGHFAYSLKGEESHFFSGAD